jgi:aldose 1-epimerase
MKNANGMVVQVIDFGAIVTSILVPDRAGKFDDVTTGFDTLSGMVMVT